MFHFSIFIQINMYASFPRKNGTFYANLGNGNIRGYFPTLHQETKSKMKKEEETTILGIDLIAKHPEVISYIDGDIAVIDNLSDVIAPEIESIKTDCLLMVFCQEGSLMLRINGEQHLLQKESCAVIPPGSILRKSNVKKPYTLKIAAVSQSFISSFLVRSKETWNIMLYLSKHPIFPVKRKGSYKMYLYKELMLQLIQEEQHAYSKQTRRFHLAGLLCEAMAEIHKLIPEQHQREVTFSRSTTIARDFMALVNADNGSHRSVSYYADRLCYTAKHLSSVIKQVTGKAPLQIINEHAIEEIKYQLKHSDMSMKEMTDYFNFPNASFFGKFVKTHTGMSPLQYRTSNEEE